MSGNRTTVVFCIPVPLQPMHRGLRVSEPLDAKLIRARLGEVAGGGQRLTPEWRVECCEVEVDLSPGGDDAEKAEQVAQILTGLGVPRGSTYEIPGVLGPISFGEAECMEVELERSALPDEAPGEHDINDLIEDLGITLRGAGELWTWEQHDRTSLFYVGASYAAMADAAAPVLADHPLAQRCRVSQRA